MLISMDETLDTRTNEEFCERDIYKTRHSYSLETLKSLKTKGINFHECRESIFITRVLKITQMTQHMEKKLNPHVKEMQSPSQYTNTI